MVAVTDNDCRIRAADQWTRQIPVDTDVSTGVYRVRRDRVGPGRIVIGVEVDLEVASARNDTVVERAPVPNRKLSVEKTRGREVRTARTCDWKDCLIKRGGANKRPNVLAQALEHSPAACSLCFHNTPLPVFGL